MFNSNPTARDFYLAALTIVLDIEGDSSIAVDSPEYLVALYCLDITASQMPKCNCGFCNR